MGKWCLRFVDPASPRRLRQLHMSVSRWCSCKYCLPDISCTAKVGSYALLLVEATSILHGSCCCSQEDVASSHGSNCMGLYAHGSLHTAAMGMYESWLSRFNGNANLHHLKEHCCEVYGAAVYGGCWLTSYASTRLYQPSAYLLFLQWRDACNASRLHPAEVSAVPQDVVSACF